VFTGYLSEGSAIASRNSDRFYSFWFRAADCAAAAATASGRAPGVGGKVLSAPESASAANNEKIRPLGLGRRAVVDFLSFMIFDSRVQTSSIICIISNKFEFLLDSLVSIDTFQV